MLYRHRQHYCRAVVAGSRPFASSFFFDHAEIVALCYNLRDNCLKDVAPDSSTVLAAAAVSGSGSHRQ